MSIKKKLLTILGCVVLSPIILLAGIGVLISKITFQINEIEAYNIADDLLKRVKKFHKINEYIRLSKDNYIEKDGNRVTNSWNISYKDNVYNKCTITLYVNNIYELTNHNGILFIYRFLYHLFNGYKRYKMYPVGKQSELTVLSKRRIDRTSKRYAKENSRKMLILIIKQTITKKVSA